jgi:hypothetical protein
MLFHGPVRVMTEAYNSHVSTSLPGVPIAYASVPPPRVGPRAWAGAAILAAGVALIGLGGCFLIGVMNIVNPQALLGNPNLQPRITGQDLGLICVLYLLAFACFGGAAALLFFGARGLLRVMRGEWAFDGTKS